MKLYECSGLCVTEDILKLIVAENKKEAEQKFIEYLDGIWVASISIIEINEIDGYKIQLIKS